MLNVGEILHNVVFDSDRILLLPYQYDVQGFSLIFNPFLFMRGEITGLSARKTIASGSRSQPTKPQPCCTTPLGGPPIISWRFTNHSNISTSPLFQETVTSRATPLSSLVHNYGCFGLRLTTPHHTVADDLKYSTETGDRDSTLLSVWRARWSTGWT